MTTDKQNYSITNIGLFSNLFEKERITMQENLKLTGSEISFNSLPAETSIPFVHSHELNEEVYIILRGEGMFMVDNHEFLIQEGSVIRVAPQGERTMKAGKEELIYICIQAKENSLIQATKADGKIHETKASWM